MPATHAQVVYWGEQARKDSVKWASNTTQDGLRLMDYQAGFMAGWRDAIKTLEIQGVVRLETGDNSYKA